MHLITRIIFRALISKKSKKIKGKIRFFSLKAQFFSKKQNMLNIQKNVLHLHNKKNLYK